MQGKLLLRAKEHVVKDEILGLKAALRHAGSGWSLIRYETCVGLMLGMSSVG